MLPLRRTIAAGAAVALAAGLAPAARAQEVGAGSGLVTVAGDASASGVRFTYEVPAEFLAATRPFDGGGPVSQASIGSGLARSAASLPFPGEVVIAGPGLFYTVTGITIPGAYPFYVAAEYPTAPESKLADPSGQYQLSARAADHSASSLAQAVFGPPDGGSGGSRTTTSIETQPDGSAVATAESVSEGLSLGGGALKIAAVRATSVTKLAGGATEAVTERSLEVEGATVAGQPVTIDAGGIHTAGGSAPVPFGPGADQVSAALAQSGMSARVLREDDGAGGTSEVLEIQSRHPLPFPGNPQGVFSWQIGKVTTTLVRTGFLPAPEPETGHSVAGGEGAAGSDTSSAAPGAAPGRKRVAGAARVPAGPSGAGPVEPAVPAALGPIPPGAGRNGATGVLPAGYDAGPVAEVFEGGASGPVAAAGDGGFVAAAGDSALARPLSRSRPVGMDRVRTLYGAVALAALMIAGLAGLWWRKGVSWAGS